MNLTELLFAEAMKTASDANRDGLGLLQQQSHSSKTMILFDTKLLPQFLASTFKHTEVDLEVFVGYIMTRLVLVDDQGEWEEVRYASAKDGYGPLMYEIAMTDSWLMSDRTTVSPSARNVWQRFLVRKDVDKQLLPAKDWFAWHPSEEDARKSALNYAYRLPVGLNTTKLVDTAEKVLQNDDKSKLLRYSTNFFVGKLER